MSIEHHRATVMEEARARAAARAALEEPPPAPPTPRRPQPMTNAGRDRSPLVPTMAGTPPPWLMQPGLLAALAIGALFALAILASALWRPTSGPSPAVVWPTAAQEGPQAPARATAGPTAPAAPTAAPAPTSAPAAAPELLPTIESVAPQAPPPAPRPAYAPPPAAAPPIVEAAPSDLVPIDPTRKEDRPASGAMWRDRP